MKSANDAGFAIEIFPFTYLDALFPCVAAISALILGSSFRFSALLALIAQIFLATALTSELLISYSVLQIYTPHGATFPASDFLQLELRYLVYLAFSLLVTFALLVICRRHVTARALPSN